MDKCMFMGIETQYILVSCCFLNNKWYVDRVCRNIAGVVFYSYTLIYIYKYCIPLI